MQLNTQASTHCAEFICLMLTAKICWKICLHLVIASTINGQSTQLCTVHINTQISLHLVSLHAVASIKQFENKKGGSSQV